MQHGNKVYAMDVWGDENAQVFKARFVRKTLDEILEITRFEVDSGFLVNIVLMDIKNETFEQFQKNNELDFRKSETAN